MSKPCDLGVGCDEAGVCYASAHDQPERCPHHKPELSGDERRLLRDFAITGFQLLSDATPEIVADLTHKGLLTWHWNGGVPIYEVTEAGRKAIT